MTVSDLKRTLKQVEEETQADWDDARMYFKIGETIFEVDLTDTLMQNAPFRAVIFRGKPIVAKQISFDSD